VGVSTVREIAEAAKVKPNTFVRMARQVGFEGYEDFRAPFREAIRRGRGQLSRPGALAAGYPQVGRSGRALCRHGRGGDRNLEETFAGIDAER
jgi:DNA-binding MurR/RpiR family transcriptional regulator